MKTQYILNIVKTVALAIVGLLLAQAASNHIPLFLDSAFLTGLVFAGLPFGWMALRSVFGGLITIGFFGTLIYWILMICASFTIGWAIMLFQLGTNVLGLFLSGKEAKGEI